MPPDIRAASAARDLTAGLVAIALINCQDHLYILVSMAFLAGIVCLIVGVLFVVFREPLGKAGDEWDTKVASMIVPRFLRIPWPSNVYTVSFFGFLFIAAGVYWIYTALFLE
ncbi:MAG: hypothetical protein J5I65_14065 [Aridibacter famidurans]|nr:hypothetical protein [Aridibacter famidurans]